MPKKSANDVLKLVGETSNTEGAKLRKARMKAGLSQAQLGKLAGSIHYRRIAAMENNNRAIPKEVWAALAGHQDKIKLLRASKPANDDEIGNIYFAAGAEAYSDKKTVAACPYRDPIQRGHYINGWYSEKSKTEDAA